MFLAYQPRVGTQPEKIRTQWFCRFNNVIWLEMVWKNLCMCRWLFLYVSLIVIQVSLSRSLCLCLYISVQARLLGQKNVIIKIVTVAFRQNGRDKMHFIWKLTNNCTTKTKKERTNVYRMHFENHYEGGFVFFFRFKFFQQRCMDNNGVVGLTW